MRLTKRLLRSDSARAIFVWFIALYIRLVHFTTRWRTVMPAATRDYLAGDRPFIVCFWHGRMVMMRAGLPPNRKARMLISEHRDGLIISRALDRLGVETVVASRKRGNLAALREFAFAGLFVERYPEMNLEQERWLRESLAGSQDYRLEESHTVCAGPSVASRRRSRVAVDVYVPRRPLDRTVRSYEIPVPMDRRVVAVDLDALLDGK